MSIDYTTAALLTSVKRRTMLPTSQILYSDADILKVLTEELHSDIVPLIMSVKEEYLTANYDQAVVVSQDAYDLPPRAVGGKLRDVCFLDDDGKEQPIALLQPETAKSDAQAVGFVFEGDQVVLKPDASAFSGLTLRMKYFRRPNNLCLTTEACLVDSVVGLVVTLTDDAPAAIVDDVLLDVIKGTPGFRTLGEDINADDVTGDDVTLASVPSGLVAGDWLAPAGYSPIAQIPYDVHPLLCQRAAVKLLEYMDDPGMAKAAEVYKDMVDKFKQLVTPRSDGTPRRLVSRGGIMGANRTVTG